jgi:hypothetical protein
MQSLLSANRRSSLVLVWGKRRLAGADRCIEHNEAPLRAGA